MTKFQAMATFDMETKQPSRFQAWMTVESRDAAKAIADSFPKYVSVKAGSSGRWVGDELVSGGSVSFSVSFNNPGVQGDRNETGLKRLKGFLERAGEIEMFPKGNALNGYATLEEFLQAVGIDVPAQTNKP